MQSPRQGTAIIIGAGPAGLTAAIELQRTSAIQPVILEASQEIGGIATTATAWTSGGTDFFPSPTG
jgi:protoporphyrinogen oxidase